MEVPSAANSVANNRFSVLKFSEPETAEFESHMKLKLTVCGRAVILFSGILIM